MRRMLVGGYCSWKRENAGEVSEIRKKKEINSKYNLQSTHTKKKFHLG